MMIQKPKTVPDPTALKKRSTLGWLFNPHLGDSIRPMGEAVSMFVTTIAMVFAMNGLFPKDHPAMKGDFGARLTLREVLQTAWKDLVFTKAGMPKVMLFFAVASGIVLIILSVITALLYGIVGRAHAATDSTSVFVAPNPSSDLAANWLDFLFNPDNSATAATNIQSTVSAVTNSAVTMPSTTIQSALAAALGIYSGAILIIAAIILFYHLTAMVVETAHHGKPMGNRASQIWAPIRLVVAIGLLVPLSSGLNSGQYIVVKVAQLGSALASNIWSGFVTTMATNTKAPPPSSVPNVSGAVADLTMMYACEYAYNYQIYLDAAGNINLPSELINSWTWTQGGPPSAPVGASTAAGTYPFTNALETGYGMCGSYTIPAEPVMSNPALQSIADAAYPKIIAAFDTARDAAAKEAVKVQAFMQPDFQKYNPPITATPTQPTSADIDAIATTYANSVASTLSAKTDISSIMTTLSNNASTEGWISAGAWFNSLSSTQAEINQIISQSLPTTVAPSIGDDGGPVTDKINETEHHNGRFVINTAGESDTAYKATIADLGAMQGYLQSGPTGTPAAGAPTTASGYACGVTDPVGCILWVVQAIASNAGAWTNNTGAGNALAIGVTFSGNNPLMEMAQWGHNNIAAGLDFFNIGVYAMGASAIVKAASYFGFLGGPVVAAILNLVSAVGSIVAGMLFFFGVLFFTMGMAIAYVVPLLPFIHFFFNTITWITCVAEAIIGIPLVALAHLNPEGEGIAGNAKGAYQMIFSVLLRPVMMVFGLIAGLLILYVAAGLLNALYAYAVAGATSTAGLTAGSHMIISRIMFSIIYVAILYSVANHAFGLISRLPNHAMEWMGGKGLQGEKMGDPGHIGSAASLATGYFGSKASSALQSGGQLASKGIDSGAKMITDNAGKQGKKVDPDTGRGEDLSGIGKYMPGAVSAFNSARSDAQDSVADKNWKAAMLAAQNNGGAGLEAGGMILGPGGGGGGGGGQGSGGSQGNGPSSSMQSAAQGAVVPPGGDKVSKDDVRDIARQEATKVVEGKLGGASGGGKTGGVLGQPSSGSSGST